MGKLIELQIICFAIIGLLLFPISNHIVNASPGWINVTSPSYGETYYESETILINWNYNDIGDYVKIELFKNGYYHTTITYNTSNDQQYSWTIPTDYASTNYYQIKVIDIDSSESDLSGIFYINERSITILSPSSGETLYASDVYTIQWTSNNIDDYVKIEYLKGLSSTIISSRTLDDGDFLWTIPDSLSEGSNYQIKITSYSHPEIFDISNYFTISKRSINILKPAGGETLYRGEKYTISWNSEKAGNSVEIKLFRGSYSIEFIAYSTINDGSYEWTIPNLNLGTNYKIRISSKIYSNVYDYTDYFEINERYINIIKPDRSSIWYPNETYSINWNSKNAGNKVEIKLFRDGIYSATIISSTDNNGAYSWIPSELFISSKRYTIEVRSLEHPALFGESEYFSIGSRDITITIENEKDQFSKGESITIYWSSKDAGNYVDINLYKEGEYYRTIKENVYSTVSFNSFNWKISEDLPTSSNYRIVINSVNYEDVFGSTGNLTIEQSLVQKITIPGLTIMIVVIIIISMYLIFKYLRKNNKEKKEELSKHKDINLANNQMISKTMTQEEYDNIWERYKP